MVQLPGRKFPGVVVQGDSLHSLVQRGVTVEGAATIILLTHRSRERNVVRALREIEAQATTKRIGIALRVFE